ncbi:MAG TPA: formimidoylglutamate deiminase [Pyrinomonadaceae bacterium]|nr:formimidoylglutamate deiminase [Pyrinomonadaceae bacterium]
MNVSNLTNWLPELIYDTGTFKTEVAVVSSEAGNIVRDLPASEIEKTITLKDRALLPGLVNAHSHAFQRVIRGRTEYATVNQKDSFWTWRELMYSAASRLSPEDVYDASRMAFLEMALSGITSVGEFHYLHRAPDGSTYDDPNLLAKEVIRAANDVGLRIAMLRVAYARAGFEKEANPQQLRFIEPNPETYLKNLTQLANDLNRGSSLTVEDGLALSQTDSGLPDGRATAPAWVGVAPHSVRAVPLPYLKEVIEFANEHRFPVHMHVAEQPAEVSACIEEYGRSPIALLATEGLLSKRFTAVHAIHVTPKAVRLLADAQAAVCACPTTERNLGDGIVPIDQYFAQSVPVSLGTDSHAQIDLMEDARELEYHLRLRKMERAILASADDEGPSAIAARLFQCATVNGAASINAPGGSLEAGRAADFFTVDLNDPSIAGASSDDLLSAVVFSLSRTAIKDVVVGGKRIVEDGRHADQEDIVERFKKLQKNLWG